jgi:hypothetical protein
VSAGTVPNLLRRAGIATRRVGTNQRRERTAPPAR